MREKRDFSSRRNRKPLTPDKLMGILNQTEGGKRAEEAYKLLTGLNPPPGDDEIVQEGE